MSTPNASTRISGARAGLLAGAALTAVLGLAACTSPAAPAPSATTAAPSTTGTSEPEAPVALVPDGTAEQNLPFFEQVLRTAVEADPETPGLTVVDALVSAGFPREAMQLTADETSVGLAADSVQVSVKTSDGCLVGQYGPKSDGVRAVIAAPIATGACLIGRTVPLTP